MAGMDGNRTHPGRLSSAPQTVLKTAGGLRPQPSIHVHCSSILSPRNPPLSAVVRRGLRCWLSSWLSRQLGAKEATLPRLPSNIDLSVSANRHEPTPAQEESDDFINGHCESISCRPLGCFDVQNAASSAQSLVAQVRIKRD